MKRNILTIFDGEESERVLRTVSEPVENITEGKAIIQDLKDSLEGANGMGLSAPQIGINKRVILVEMGQDKEEKDLVGIINPIITARSEFLTRDFDGCLSIPNLITWDTLRPTWLHVMGTDERGKTVTLKLHWLDARIAHHEIDHLNGILFTSRIAQDGTLYTVEEE